MKKVVIALTGVKTSGKSTVSEIIESVLFGAREVALADKLKNVCAEAFNLDKKYFHDQSLKEKNLDQPKKLTTSIALNILSEFNISLSTGQFDALGAWAIGREFESPRKIAQIIGTELLREYGGEDVHCKSLPLHGDINVVSDMRFPNEFRYFSNMEDIVFLPLYIQRDEAESHVTEFSHSSETLLFTFTDKCVKIDNNGSLEETKKQVVDILKKKELL